MSLSREVCLSGSREYKSRKRAQKSISIAVASDLLRGFVLRKIHNVLVPKVSYALASYAPHSVSFSFKFVAKPVLYAHLKFFFFAF